jgi:hypothetical protein
MSAAMSAWELEAIFVLAGPRFFGSEVHADKVLADAKKKSNLILFVGLQPQDGLVEIAVTAEVGDRQRDMVQIPAIHLTDMRIEVRDQQQPPDSD